MELDVEAAGWRNVGQWYCLHEIARSTQRHGCTDQWLPRLIDQITTDSSRCVHPNRNEPAHIRLELDRSELSLAARQPTKLEWYLKQAHDPIYTVTPDPFVTWELRHHLGQEPNPRPAAVPSSFEQRRIAHNAAIAAGDVALADRLRQELEQELDRSAASDVGDGVRLIGTRMEPGVGGQFSVYFLAQGPIAPEAMFNIAAEVTATRRWTLIGKPTRVRATGMPFEMPTPLWKAGMIYRSMSEIRPRPGTEKHVGSWVSHRSSPRYPVKPSAGELTVLTTKW